jgi:hypothetical protein
VACLDDLRLNQGGDSFRWYAERRPKRLEPLVYLNVPNRARLFARSSRSRSSGPMILLKDTSTTRRPSNGEDTAKRSLCCSGAPILDDAPSSALAGA